MRRLTIPALFLAGSSILGGSARGQALGGSPYAGPAFGTFGMPDGLYTTLRVPGMGSGGPGLWMYFPSTGTGGSFTPSPMAGQVAGVQVPVVGTGSSVYLPGPNSPANPPRALGGGLGLPSPFTPPAAIPAPARPAAAPRAVARAADAPAPAAAEAANKAAERRSTLKARRGIR